MTKLRERIAQFTSRFGIELPIMNAPMFGVTTPEMVAAVSNAGGLGVLAADFLTAEEIGSAVDQVRQRTKRPFAVNLRIPVKTDEKGMSSLTEALSDLRQELGCEERSLSPDFEEQFEAVLQKDIPILRVCFGGLRELYADKLKEKGVLVIGAATTLREAKVQRSAGADAVVVQGAEAGGPRLSFEDSDEVLVGLMSLAEPAARATQLPVIASGGIASARQMAGALMLGASAVEVGTYLVRTKESAMQGIYEEALEFASETSPRFTRLISGRLTRAVPSGLIEALKASDISPISYPVQYECMRPVFQAAKTLSRADLADLSCGTSIPVRPPVETKEAICTLCSQCRQLLTEEFE